jgi:hypothetical protein
MIRVAPLINMRSLVIRVGFLLVVVCRLVYHAAFLILFQRPILCRTTPNVVLDIRLEGAGRRIRENTPKGIPLLNVGANACDGIAVRIHGLERSWYNLQKGD